MGSERAHRRRAHRRCRASPDRSWRRRLGGSRARCPGRRLSVRARRLGEPCRSVLPVAAPRGQRPVTHPRYRDVRDCARARARARRARPLRAARRHVLGGGELRRRHPAAGRAARARRHRDRADAGRDLSGRARLGVRRSLHLRAARGLRRAGRPGAPGGRGPPRRARCRARRRLQPRRTRQRGVPSLWAVLHGPARRHALGRRARLRRAGRPRVGDPERRALGPRLLHRRTAPRRRPRRPRRLAAATCWRSWPTASVRRAHRRS